MTRRGALAALAGLIVKDRIASVLVLDTRTGVVTVRDESRAACRPGSTIKPFALLALLNAKKLAASERVFCSRGLTIGGRSFACSHPRLPEGVTIETALAYSCNEFVAYCAQRFEDGEFARVLAKYGITAEAATDEDERRLQALGEARIEVTPRQMLHAYAMLAKSAPQAIRDGLRCAVAYGTAQKAAIDGIEVAGKTGSTRASNGVPIAWFAGFAPAQDPRIVTCVRTQGYSGGADAAPLAAEALRRYLT